MYIRKPTLDQKASYLGLYPLYGFVRNNGHECIVEYLGEGKDAPNYEVLAPAGFTFVPDGVTSLLCSTLDDMETRLQGNTLEQTETDE